MSDTRPGPPHPAPARVYRAIHVGDVRNDSLEAKLYIIVRITIFNFNALVFDRPGNRGFPSETWVGFLQPRNGTACRVLQSDQECVKNG